jgi:serine/threonine-protein kinase HipA
MASGRHGERESSFAACLAASAVYGLTRSQAREIIDRQAEVIRKHWGGKRAVIGRERPQRRGRPGASEVPG